MLPGIWILVRHDSGDGMRVLRQGLNDLSAVLLGTAVVSGEACPRYAAHTLTTLYTAIWAKEYIYFNSTERINQTPLNFVVA